jgi:hypothetical protein
MNAINGFMSCWRVARCDTVLTDAGIRRLRGGFAVQGRQAPKAGERSKTFGNATKEGGDERRANQFKAAPRAAAAAAAAIFAAA